QELFAERERVAAAVGQALGAPGVLTVARGRALACWAAAGSGEPRPYTPRHPLRVALGSRGSGVEGFRRSHAEALLARRVAGTTAVAWVADVSPDALLTHDIDEARRFVATELGPLAADDDGSCRLRATLEIFLDEGASFVRAARRLGVHENTVT